MKNISCHRKSFNITGNLFYSKKYNKAEYVQHRVPSSNVQVLIIFEVNRYFQSKILPETAGVRCNKSLKNSGNLASNGWFTN